MIFKLSAIC